MTRNHLPHVALGLAVGLALCWMVFGVQSGLARALDSRTTPTTADAGPDGHLWRAMLLSGAARREALEAAVTAHAAVPRIHAARFTDLLAATPEAAGRPAWLGRLAALAEAARPLEPDNALYDVGLAVATIDGGLERKGDAVTVADRDRCEAAAAHLLAGGETRDALRTYGGEQHPMVLARALGMADDLTMLNLVDLIGRWAAHDAPLQGALRGLRDLSDYAGILYREGRPDEAHALWARVAERAAQLQSGSRYLNQLLMGIAIERHAREAWITALRADGKADAVDRQWRILAAVDAARRDARALPDGVELSAFGVLDSMLAPVGGMPDAGPAIGRRADYSLLTLAALGLLALTLLLAAACAWARAPEGDTLPLPEVLATTGGAVLLPLAAYLCFDRWHPSRELGLGVQPAALLQPAALCLLMLVGLLGFARRYVDAPSARGWTALLWLAAPTVFASFFWVRQSPAMDGFVAAEHVLAAGLLLAILVAAAGLLTVPAAARRLLAGSAAAGFVATVLVAATLAVPGYLRASTLHGDKVLRPMISDEVRSSNWRALAELDREALASK